jgi:hypothetical protein
MDEITLTGTEWETLMQAWNEYAQANADDPSVPQMTAKFDSVIFNAQVKLSDA